MIKFSYHKSKLALLFGAINVRKCFLVAAAFDEDGVKTCGQRLFEWLLINSPTLKPTACIRGPQIELLYSFRPVNTRLSIRDDESQMIPTVFDFDI